MILIDDIVFAEHLKFSMVAQTTVNIIHVADNINGIMVVKNIMNPVLFFKAPGINNIIFGYEMGMFDITDLDHRQILLLGFDFLLYITQQLVKWCGQDWFIQCIEMLDSIFSAIRFSSVFADYDHTGRRKLLQPGNDLHTMCHIVIDI